MLSRSNSYESHQSYDSFMYGGGSTGVGSGNPQSAMAITRAPDERLTSKKIMDAIADCMSDDVKRLTMRPDDLCEIAIVIDSLDHVDHAVKAIRNPVSTCRIDCLAVLNDIGKSEKNDDDDTLHRDAYRWITDHTVDPSTVTVVRGGLTPLLQRPSVHAVYLCVPADRQRECVLAALRAGKHVLIKDPVSTPCDEFVEQVECARKLGKFLQFSTMFVHHYRSLSFMDCVSVDPTFGAIQEIDAILTVNLQELDLVNVSLPLTEGQGCIRRLARYCVLISTLMLQAEHEPLSAQVTESLAVDAVEEENDGRDENRVNGEPVEANCVVKFRGNVTLKCHVAYTAAQPREVLTVKSASNKYATMTDFVIPHPDGLATYRVYDKKRNKITGKLDIVKGECLDVPLGPPQNVTLWREFHRLCRSVDSVGWDGLDDTRKFTESSMMTKRILMALDQSYQKDGIEIMIPQNYEKAS